MTTPKILVFAGSIRTGSLNGRLAAAAAKEAALLGADVTLISLADYPLPLYDADEEDNSGPPDNAIKLKKLMCAQQGVFIASPEYNASVTPLLKNALDWISRVREGREPALAAYHGRVFALGAVSPRTHGGMRSLLALRQILELGCGAFVIPSQVELREAAEAFDADGKLNDAAAASDLRRVAADLVETARMFA